MRRLIAFLATLYTVLIIVAIGVVPYFGDNGFLELQTDVSLSVDYKGGYDVLYQLVDENGEAIKNKSLAEEAAVAVQERIDAAGIKSSEIYVEDGSEIRATVATTKASSLKAVQSLIESNLEVSFRDETGNLLATGDEMLDKDEPATVVTGQTTYVTLNLTAAGIEVFDNQIMDKIPNDGKVVVWLGYTGPDDHSDIDENDETIVMDSFAEYQQLASIVSQYGYSYLTEDQKMSYNRYSYKILTFATISEDLRNQGGLSGMGQDKLVLNANYTTAQARSIANLISSDKQEYSFELLNVTKLPATHGERAFFKVVMAAAIALIVASVIIIVLYRLPGIAAVSTLLAYVGLSLVTFSAFGGEFGTEIIIALVVAVAGAVAAITSMFGRINDEVYKGKSLERAYAEGSRKSNSAILDFSFLVLIVSVVMFIFGKRDIKSITTMLVMVSAYLILIVICLGKLLSNCIYKSRLCAKHPGWFGIDVSLVPDVQNGEEQKYFGKFTNTNFVGKLSKGFKAIGAFVLVGLLAGGIWWGFTGSPLNFSRDFADASIVTIETNLEEFFIDEGSNDVKNEKAIKDAIKSWNIPVEPSKITYEIDTYNKLDRICFKLTFDQNLNEVKMSNSDLTVAEHLETIFEDLVYATEIKNEDSEVSGIDDWCFTYSNTADSTPVIAKRTAGNTFIVLLAGLVAVILYVSVRFKYTYAFAMISGLLTEVVVLFAALALFHINITIGVFATLVAVVFFSMVLKSILFDRLRENVAGGRKKSYTHDEKLAIANTSLQQSALVSILIIAITLITALLVMIFGGSIVLAECFTLIFGIIAVAVSTLFITTPLWIFFEDKLTVRLHTPNSEKKKKKRIVIDPVEEQVFIGIND